MKTNAGSIDRIARLLIGVLLIVLTTMGTIGAWGWIGIVLIATAAFGYCPLYSLFGFNTCPTKKV